jgi:enoyl-CoA hydratase/carnithine racemase
MAETALIVEGLERRVESGTLELALDRPPRNLLTPELMHALSEELRAADRDETVRAIVLTGRGELFCGGLDIAELRARGTPLPFAEAAVELLRVVPTLGKPVVGRVNGDALALGYSLVCLCDLAVAVDGASLGTFEVTTGIWPMIAQVPPLKRLGPRIALENVITGRPFDAERALQIGLVNAVVAAADLDATVAVYVAAASQASPQALALGRRCFYDLVDLPYGAALDHALGEFPKLFAPPT